MPQKTTPKQNPSKNSTQRQAPVSNANYPVPVPPQGYTLAKTLSFTRDNPITMWVNILMALLLLIFYSVFSNLTTLIVDGFEGAFLGGFSGWGIALVFVMAFVMMFLHEGFHYLGMWMLSGKKPLFTAKALNPRAILAGTAFPPLVYAAMKLTPLVVLTAIYFFIAPLLPMDWLSYAIFFFAGNAAYAAQDLLCVAQVFSVPGDKLIEDHSERIFIFTKTVKH